MNLGLETEPPQSGPQAPAAGESCSTLSALGKPHPSSSGSAGTSSVSPAVLYWAASPASRDQRPCGHRQRLDCGAGLWLRRELQDPLDWGYGGGQRAEQTQAEPPPAASTSASRQPNHKRGFEQRDPSSRQHRGRQGSFPHLHHPLSSAVGRSRRGNGCSQSRATPGWAPCSAAATPEHPPRLATSPGLCLSSCPASALDEPELQWARAALPCVWPADRGLTAAAASAEVALPACPSLLSQLPGPAEIDGTNKAIPLIREGREGVAEDQLSL